MTIDFIVLGRVAQRRTMASRTLKELSLRPMIGSHSKLVVSESSIKDRFVRALMWKGWIHLMWIFVALWSYRKSRI